MKTLGQKVSLTGTDKISMTEFRAQPGEVIAQVELGQRFTIEKSGKPVATLSKAEPEFDWAALQRLRSHY